jgi:glutamate-1-semialdehyde aminotransferase
LSAICGRAEIMDHFKPAGDVQHSGTFNAPLVSILGGLAFCEEIAKPHFYPELLAQCDRFHEGLDELIERVGVPVVAPRHGARFGLLIGLERPPVTYRDTLAHRKDIMLAFVRETAERGVYFHDYGGSACHHGFSAAHMDGDLDRVLEVMEEALVAIRGLFSSGPSQGAAARRVAPGKDRYGG